MAVVNRVTFDQLAGVPLVRSYEQAFRKATGIALKLVPAGTPTARLSLGEHENAFCALVAKQRAVGEACRQVEAEIQQKVGKTLTAKTGCCLAGLHLLAVPVMVAGHHVATWIGGWVFQKRPTPAGFRSVAKKLARLGVTEGLPQIEAAFFRGHIVAEEQFQASAQLLDLFAQHLGQNAEHLLLLSRPDEPRCVACAKEFIQAHFAEELSLPKVAAAVHLSPYHFCRVFRAATGFTLTEYVSRVRVERAKTLLADSSVRVSEVTFAAGFGSISQFNTAFRRYLGMAPTQYRTRQRRRRS
jgi:AraC-like DNA-binding protein